VEKDIDLVRLRLVEEKQSSGIEFTDSVLWSCSREAMMIVTHNYVKSGKFKDIFDHLIEQWDGGDGYQYFHVVSEGLIEQGDVEDARQMWTTLIAARKDLRKSEELIAMQHYLDVLRKLGDEKHLREAQREFVERGTSAAFYDSNRRVMDEQNFWDIIRRVKEESHHYIDRPGRLQTRLLTYPVEAIEKFDGFFQEKMDKSYAWNLWALAYLAFGGCSDDGFGDFRAWLISEGQNVFESVLADPNSIIDLGIEPQQLEGYLYVTAKAYELKTKNSIPRRASEILKPSGEEWNENDDDLQLRYPRLWNHFEDKR
jgi:hypothetical protein